jgi:hypothetical protein
MVFLSTIRNFHGMLCTNRNFSGRWKKVCSQKEKKMFRNEKKVFTPRKKHKKNGKNRGHSGINQTLCIKDFLAFSFA